MYFVGTQKTTIDQKGRIIIPAKFRAPLKDESRHLYLSILPIKDNEKIIAIYPESLWKTFTERIVGKAEKSEDVSEFMRKLAWDTEMCKLDSQWRILLPQKLVSNINLKNEIMLAGGMDKLELWDYEHWMKVNNELTGKSGGLSKKLYGQN